MDILELPSDVWRSIILICKISYIKNLSLVDKFFYSLCCEKNLWLEKFKDKNLIIINNNIKNVGEYLNEYRKVSYSTYTSNCLIDMITSKKYSTMWNTCWFNPYFLIEDLTKILNKDHLIFNKVEDYSIKKYIDISINIKKKELIYYKSCNYKMVDGYNEVIKVLTENYDNINTIESLITKILYYNQLININDMDCYPIVISKNSTIDDLNLNIYKKDIINRRRKYWDECYSKYEKLYF